MDSPEVREWDRIAFVTGRDGVPAAIVFVQQALGQYESAIREADSGGNQYGGVYRESLLASIRVYHQYLAQECEGHEPQT